MPKYRSKIQIARDRKRIAELYLKGWLQADIATELGVDQSTISRDLKAIQGGWQESVLVDFNEAKGRELAKIDQLEITYWEAWDRSLDEFKSKTVKAKGTNKKEVAKNAEQTIKTEDRNGDPRFLQGIQWCIEKRCKLFGLDKPLQVEVSWRRELKQLWDTGTLTPQDIVDELGADTAREFFESAGIVFGGVGMADADSG